ncbi:MAG: hypothetical protein NUV64_01155 [Parcubacteria group bacterium]|nr:hypothetical protein [Parcubacteria group bacterium]MCR4342294.1 hypothetical protein [Patescibacteria group bacterium]
MENKRINIILAVVIILSVVVVSGIVFWSWWSGRTANVVEEPLPQAETPLKAPEKIITAKHQFKDGTHTIVGEIDMPTPCHLLDWDVIIAESFPEQVTINFNSIYESRDVCAQVVTPQRFKVTFEASENAVISATLDGKKIILNLIEALKGEDLDSFELFIKG